MTKHQKTLFRLHLSLVLPLLSSSGHLSSCLHQSRWYCFHSAHSVVCSGPSADLTMIEPCPRRHCPRSWTAPPDFVSPAWRLSSRRPTLYLSYSQSSLWCCGLGRLGGEGPCPWICLYRLRWCTFALPRPAVRRTPGQTCQRFFDLK